MTTDKTSQVVLAGDCREVLKTLDAGSVHACVTSPPYFGLRDYNVDGQIGLESTPEEYIAELVAVFREVRRVLRDDGSLWLNLGDSYAMDSKWGGSTGGRHAKGVHGGDARRQRRSTGLPDKNLIGIPWRVALALQADGWILREDVIWHKPNPMPESMRDRCTRSHEYLFHLTKRARYYHDHDAIKEPAKEWTGRAATFDRSGNAVSEHVIPGQVAAQHRPRTSVKRGGFGGKTQALPGREAFRAVTPTRTKRSVWTVATRPYPGAHFATFPVELIKPCILASVPAGGTVLDLFGGAATTAVAASALGRNALVIELNPEYVDLSEDRLGLSRKSA